MPGTKIVREHDDLTAERIGLEKDELKDLRDFAFEHQTDDLGNYRPVLTARNDRLFAGNYVGIIETRKGTVLEILPKVDFNEGAETDETKRIFYDMLRTWHRFKSQAVFNTSQINTMRHFNMQEVFVHLFLNNLVLLTQRGLARHYHPVEGNLPCLRGRILFPQHIRENVANRARFYVGYDVFSANRPANRLIHSTIDQLHGRVRQPRNQQLLHQLRISFSGIPLSEDYHGDLDRYRLDRTIQHYDPVMPWVRLFLLKEGLTTFAGKHLNQALLFPMWEIFEDFVAASFRRHQRQFKVRQQGPSEPLAYIDDRKVFYMKPDICLTSHDGVRLILDTKWKRINAEDGDLKHGVNQADMYQMFVYGKKYKCRKVALVYPKTDKFDDPLHYKFDQDLSLVSVPFDVTEPKCSVRDIIRHMKQHA